MSASDAEYFAEICRDLAQSLQSEAGRTACEAQDEVEYIVCDVWWIEDNTLRIMMDGVLYAMNGA